MKKRRAAVMANPKKRVPENVAGDFFVDSTCIDCNTCRQIAPAVFGEALGTSFVKAQPAAMTGELRLRRCWPGDDLSVLHRLLAVLRSPYESGCELAHFREPGPEGCGYRTFCGA